MSSNFDCKYYFIGFIAISKLEWRFSLTLNKIKFSCGEYLVYSTVLKYFILKLAMLLPFPIKILRVGPFKYFCETSCQGKRCANWVKFSRQKT